MIDMLLAASGGLAVAFSLALVGGGGSILATPFLAYVIGLPPHAAIGTSAVGVGANAAIGLFGKARDGAVSWSCGLTFAAAGVTGAVAGAAAGKATDGEMLLGFFALLMLVVATLMLRRKERPPGGEIRLGRHNVLQLLGYGLGTGLLAGFFGIGGGFLIVPGLMAATAMPIFNAMATSLVGVTALGATTATSYAFSGLVDWGVAAAFIAGGFIGSALGQRLAKRLAVRKGALTRIFAALIYAVAAYMLWRWAS
ncbi:sulfite exporter TauE/SafE family protein [Sphingomicrobium lutaoense]|nr:sulfite exporter TauE/SafE family protein [Sphingomicrobium lutaoense]